MVSTFIVLSMVSVASAQPWPTDNPRGTRQLDALIATATRDKAVDRLRSSDPNQPASFRVNDSAKLKAVFLSEKDALTDETCDAVVLNWRNAAGSEKPFWGQWLRVMAEASRRPRTTGLADLFQGAVLSGDPASQDRVRKSFLSACENFRVANDLAWEAAAENELGLQALSKDQFEEADAAFKKAGDLYTKAFGPKHLLVASTIRNRGNGYSKRQDYMTAARLYREAVDLLDVADPNNAAERVSILQNLSSTYFSQNDMISAIGCIREATEIITKIRGPNDPSLLPFLENLGSIYFSRGEHDKAFESAAQAYEIAKTALGPDNPRVVRYLRTLGDGKRQLGRRKEALEDYRKGLSILEKATPKDDEGIADLRLAIGDNLRELRDANGAIQEYQAAIDLFRHMNSRVSKIKAALTLSKIASVNDSMGRRKEAGELHRQAIADLMSLRWV
jgi:tetratricopeptide (TPR) repeat protein